MSALCDWLRYPVGRRWDQPHISLHEQIVQGQCLGADQIPGSLDPVWTITKILVEALVFDVVIVGDDTPAEHKHRPATRGWNQDVPIQDLHRSCLLLGCDVKI